MDGDDFKLFVSTAEAIKSTSKKLEKVRILAGYFVGLDGDSLDIACRMFSARIFPPWEGAEVKVGYSTIIDVVFEVTSAKEAEFRDSLLRYGDLGDVTSELMKRKKIVPLDQGNLTLNSIYSTFRKMAQASGSGSGAQRRSLFKALLINSSPLEAKYLVKLLTRELRIGLEEGLVEEAIARAFRATGDEVRDAHLLTGDIGLTAVLAKGQRLSEADIKLMRPTNFMLAETMQTPQEIAEYFEREVLAEFKYDGVRAQTHKSGENVRIFSRRLEDVSRSFPELVEAVQSLSGDVVLDGEILAYEKGRPLPFQTLQQRLHRKQIDRSIIKEIPLAYFVYDILFHNESTLIRRPLAERRGILESLRLGGRLLLSEVSRVQSADEIESLFDESKRLGFEGLVIKDPVSPYRPGKRGKHWVKLKKELDTLDVVIVAAEYGHGKRAGVISDYTFAVRDGETLKVVGKAYSGLTDEEILQLTERLKEITLRDMGFHRYVKPEIVLEVAFDNIQKSHRHDSGFALRFPRIKRLREDKRPDEIDTLDTVAKIYQRQVSMSFRDTLK